MLSVFLILRRAFNKNPNIFCKKPLENTPDWSLLDCDAIFSVTKSLSMHHTWYKWDSTDHFQGSVMHDHFHMVSKYLQSEVYLFALFYSHHFLIDCASEGWTFWWSMPQDFPRGSGPSGLPLHGLWPFIYMLRVKSQVLHLLQNLMTTLMGNYTTFFMLENPRRGAQARNFTNQIVFRTDIFRKLTLSAPVMINLVCICKKHLCTTNATN